MKGDLWIYKYSNLTPQNWGSSPKLQVTGSSSDNRSRLRNFQVPQAFLSSIYQQNAQLLITFTYSLCWVQSHLQLPLLSPHFSAFSIEQTLINLAVPQFYTMSTMAALAHQQSFWIRPVSVLPTFTRSAFRIAKYANRSPMTRRSP